MHLTRVNVLFIQINQVFSHIPSSVVIYDSTPVSISWCLWRGTALNSRTDSWFYWRFYSVTLRTQMISLHLFMRTFQVSFGSLRDKQESFSVVFRTFLNHFGLTVRETSMSFSRVMQKNEWKRSRHFEIIIIISLYFYWVIFSGNLLVSLYWLKQNNCLSFVGIDV